MFEKFQCFIVFAFLVQIQALQDACNPSECRSALFNCGNSEGRNMTFSDLLKTCTSCVLKAVDKNGNGCFPCFDCGTSPRSACAFSNCQKEMCAMNLEVPCMDCDVAFCRNNHTKACCTDCRKNFVENPRFDGLCDFMLLNTTVSACSLENCQEDLSKRGNAMEAIFARLDALEAKNEELEAKNIVLEKELKQMKNMRGELRIFEDECPEGWVEFNRTQGFILTGRPKGAKAMVTVNRPLIAGEVGRVPEHAHKILIQDLGHTHTMIVNDPGHGHLLNMHDQETISDNAKWGGFMPGPGKNPQKYHDVVNKTGIIVDALPAKSNIQVSLTSSDEDDEGYPLVYILLCKRFT